MSDIQNVDLCDLLSKTWEYIVSLKRAPKTTYMYKCYGISPVKLYFSENSFFTYSEDKGNECILYHYQLFQKGDINRSKYRCVRKTIVIMTSIMKTGDYVWSYENSLQTVVLSDNLTTILNNYVDFCLNQGYRITTMRGIKPRIKHFLKYVESLGNDNLMNLKFSDISGYIPVLAKDYENIGDVLSALRTFGAYLNANTLCNLDLQALFTIKIPHRKKLNQPFYQNEVTSILSAPDIDSNLGKRDYAIMMIAIHTGLRGVDVLTLKFSDIDWKSKEIHIIQSKTSVPLILPVSTSVLNAIAKYILEARPDNSSSEIIFLRERPPYDPLKTWSAHSIIKRNATKVGIEWDPKERKGFHSFRRTLASQMLCSDVAVDTIKEVLGHSNVDATKPYLSVDTKGLNKCPLNLDFIQMRREELK